jgi:hypothetical protein
VSGGGCPLPQRSPLDGERDCREHSRVEWSVVHGDELGPKLVRPGAAMIRADRTVFIETSESSRYTWM